MDLQKFKICCDYHVYNLTIEQINKVHYTPYHITAETIEGWMSDRDTFKAVMRQMERVKAQPVKKQERKCLHSKIEPYYQSEKELMEAPIMFPDFRELISYDEAE